MGVVTKLKMAESPQAAGTDRLVDMNGSRRSLIAEWSPHVE